MSSLPPPQPHPPLGPWQQHGLWPDATKPAAAPVTTPLVLGAVGVLGAVMLLVGSFMPWASVQTFIGGISVSGFDAGDGKLTAAAGLIAIVLLVLAMALRNWPLFLAGAIASGLGGLVAIYDIVDVSKTISDADLGGLAQASVGSGLWVCAIGSCLAGAAALGALIALTSGK